MDEKHDRIDEFKQEIADMRIRPPEDATERMWLIAGIVLPVLGLGAIFVGWWGASGSAYPQEQLPLRHLRWNARSRTDRGRRRVVRAVLDDAVHAVLAAADDLRGARAQTDRTVEAMNWVESLLRAATRPRSKADD